MTSLIKLASADRAGRPTISRIELYTRYTASLWGMLHEKDIKVPSRNLWPPGASLPPTAARLQEAKPSLPKDAGSLDSASAAPKKSVQEKELEEVCPHYPTCGKYLLVFARLTVDFSDHTAL